MKIRVATPIQFVPGRRLPNSPAPLPRAEPAPLPTTIDLMRQLEFGGSEVDEAGVVLVEMSVLVYEPLETIRRAVEPLRFDRCSAMDAGRDRAADWRYLQTRADLATPFKPFPVFTGLFGLPVSPWTRQFIQEALARQSGLPSSRQIPSAGPGLWPTDRAAGVALAAALQRVKKAPASDEESDRNAPPRVLAILHGDNALIVFRGTSTGLDWWRDASCWPARAWPLRHEGFHRTWQEVRPLVDAWLAEVAEKLGHPPTIYLGGHSLGGAVATLAAVDLARAHKVARVVTLGSPRVAGWRFRKVYASTRAASASDGSPRYLAAVTTRWVHGTDLFATLIPPPGPTVHVSESSDLRADDRLDIEAYFPSNLMDTTPLMNLVSRLGESTAGPLGVARSPWTQDLRHATSQTAIWLAMLLPWAWWTRLFLPLFPLLAEQFTRSGYQHKCRRYLGFMPPTALYRAMHPAVPVPVPVPGQPEAKQHIVKVE